MIMSVQNYFINKIFELENLIETLKERLRLMKEWYTLVYGVFDIDVEEVNSEESDQDGSDLDEDDS